MNKMYYYFVKYHIRLKQRDTSIYGTENVAICLKCKQRVGNFKIMVHVDGQNCERVRRTLSENCEEPFVIVNGPLKFKRYIYRWEKSAIKSSIYSVRVDFFVIF